MMKRQGRNDGPGTRNRQSDNDLDELWADEPDYYGYDKPTRVETDAPGTIQRNLKGPLPDGSDFISLVFTYFFSQ